jgi:hypothetical protein
MQKNQSEISVRGIMLLFLGVISAVAMQQGFAGDKIWYKVAIITSTFFFLMLLVPYGKKSRRNKA